jgi:drug/metabolite transporter (DMT)-like permease
VPKKRLGCLLGFIGLSMIWQRGPLKLDNATIAAALTCISACACYGISTPIMKRATERMQPLAIAAGMHANALLLMLPGAVWALPKARFT